MAARRPKRERKPRKDDITVRGFMILEDRRIVPLEEVTPEEMERFRENAARRGSAMLSDYYTQHPDEFAKL